MAKVGSLEGLEIRDLQRVDYFRIEGFESEKFFIIESISKLLNLFQQVRNQSINLILPIIHRLQMLHSSKTSRISGEVVRG